MPLAVPVMTINRGARPAARALHQQRRAGRCQHGNRRMSTAASRKSWAREGGGCQQQRHTADVPAAPSHSMTCATTRNRSGMSTTIASKGKMQKRNHGQMWRTHDRWPLQPQLPARKPAKSALLAFPRPRHGTTASRYHLRQPEGDNITVRGSHVESVQLASPFVTPFVTDGSHNTYTYTQRHVTRTLTPLNSDKGCDTMILHDAPSTAMSAPNRLTCSRIFAVFWPGGCVWRTLWK